MMKKSKFLIQLLISLLFLYVAFRNIHVNELKQAITHVNYQLVLLGTMLQFISYLFRGIRWRALLAPIKPVPFRSSFSVLAISYAANNTLPLRAGDVLRAIIIGQKERISKLSSFSTVLLEKIVDGLTVILFLIVGLLFLPAKNDWSIRTIVLSATIFIGVMLVIYLVKRFRQQVITLFMRTAHKLAGDKARSVAGNLLEKCLVSLDLINSKQLLFTLIWTSLVIWSLEASLYVLVAVAFGQALSVALVIGIVTVSVVNMGIMIPSSPGYVGTFEFFCIFSMSLFGIGEDVAASYSIVVHFAMYLPITVLGAIVWLFHSINKKVEETSA